MWSDSDEYYGSDNEEMEVQEQEPPPGTTGLALAEHYFDLLSPVAGTPAQWTAYTGHRQGANAKFRNVFTRRKRSIADVVATIEKELDLEEGTLQRCVLILGRSVEWADVDKPRDLDILVRIYSPATPKYIDVHLVYYCRVRWNSIEWSYSLGYKIYNRISGPPSKYHDPPTDGPPSMWHIHGGWQSICWGYFDDKDNYGPKWRRAEVAGMGLCEEGVFDVYEVLFGPIESPPSEDANALLEHRRKLVVAVRLLFAAVGVKYKVTCTDEERDQQPWGYMLEGLSDLWVARGIRAACGFQLSGDAEAESRGKEERRQQAKDVDDDEDDSDDDEW